ncbi:MAG: metallophosphoesterase [Calditrichia bacterium]|nr:metallophosphoesterase [Calditrichia bacterium]
MLCFFVTDLHGKKKRFIKLLKTVSEKKPELLFIGGDIFPSYLFQTVTQEEFLNDFILAGLEKLKKEMSGNYPRVFVILGNDDGKLIENEIIKSEKNGLWQYIHQKKIELKGFKIFGYNYSPPSPFLLKDWERYDVSRYVDPGCVSPEEGSYTVETSDYEKKYTTIKSDLNEMVKDEDLSKSIFLFHAPPYKTNLDRADLDGKMIDHVPLDVHVGSIAIRRFIEEYQPMLTLHGHIHESTRLMGAWKQQMGNTFAFNAAHDGGELSIIEFDLNDLNNVERVLY